MISPIMGLTEEATQLRRYLDDLASHDDDGLARFARWKPSMPPGLYWQLRWLAALALRWLEAARLKRPDPWPVALKQSAWSLKAKPLLIWGVGTDCDTLRAACRKLAELHETLRGFAPVLVTDVADFAYFSRLGWLVEYLPTVAGSGDAYEQRKARFIARLYRGAPALPVCAAFVSECKADDVAEVLVSIQD